jgi:hypothetical protein
MRRRWCAYDSGMPRSCDPEAKARVIASLDPEGLCGCGCGEKTPLSPYTDLPRGYVKGYPTRYVKGHNNRGRHIKSERYRVEDCGYETPCWVWLLNKTAGGYGLVQIGGKMQSAPRAYFRERYGEIPEGADLDHLCVNPPCVRPDHLQAVTKAENNRRSRVAKLTYADVDEIRSLLAAGMTHGAIGARYGVHRITISDIANGRSWVAPGGVLLAR